MRITLTKTFSFSTCYRQGGRVIGRNFRMHVKGAPTQDFDERAWVEGVERGLISKLHTGELTRFEGLASAARIDDVIIVQALLSALQRLSPQGFLLSLTLERDASTSTTLELQDPGRAV